MALQNTSKIMISACLLGDKVRYNASSAVIINDTLNQWLKNNRLVSICPEILAGASIPRMPSEIVGGDGNQVLNGRAFVFNKAGNDETILFINGAKKTLEIAKKNNICIAILKERSPSCGSHVIYDGTFSGKRIHGKGVTAALLERNGIRVFNENEVEQALLFLTINYQEIMR